MTTIPAEFVGKISKDGKHNVAYLSTAGRRALISLLETDQRDQGANFKNASDVSVCHQVVQMWATELVEKALGRKYTGLPRLEKRFK